MIELGISAVFEIELPGSSSRGRVVVVRGVTVRSDDLQECRLGPGGWSETQKMKRHICPRIYLLSLTWRFTLLCTLVFVCSLLYRLPCSFVDCPWHNNTKTRRDDPCFRLQ